MGSVIYVIIASVIEIIMSLMFLTKNVSKTFYYLITVFNLIFLVSGLLVVNLV